ncbi:MAG TPA: glutathione peroxidase [Gemmataceae bacterium]|nr:glutathione peroxidase [Gemmataceae bacterium]
MLRPVIILLVISLALCGLSATAGEKGGGKVPAVLNFKMTGLDGKEVDLSKYQGQVVLIVNVASECGYTPQYEPLQALYAKHSKEGLVILGVPCNQFGKQEPGTSKEIAEFCTKEYGVTFPMTEKVDVNGKSACLLYKYLTGKDTNGKFAGAITWNFEKFLIGRNGEVVARFTPDADPEGPEFQKKIRDELAKK